MASSGYKERLRRYNEYLEESILIDVKALREYCFEGGCPDDNPHHRSLTWKILLGYLGPNKAEWSDSLNQQRKIYRQFVSELVNCDQSSTQNDDHPLNCDPASQWNKHFRDNEILSQIFKDVRRLYPDISFFQQRVPKKYGNDKEDCDIIGRASNSRTSSFDVVKTCFGAVEKKNYKDKYQKSLDDDDVFDQELLVGASPDEYYWQVVARILFIYARLNPGQGYVQGMNEIIGPIFYVFAKDSKEEWAKHCEADTFWCFTSLMSEIRDMYNKQLDSDRSIGVVSMMTRLTNLLLREDPQLYHHICQNQNIKPHYYAFRWITLLLSQEFSLPEVLRLWDFLFADEFRFSFLISICCSMLKFLKDDLMRGDFSSNMKLLQNFPDRIDVNTVINGAKRIVPINLKNG